MTKPAPIYVAIDETDLTKVSALIDKLAPLGASFKFGLEFYCAHGREGLVKLIERVKAQQPAPSPSTSPTTNTSTSKIFLDLKLHDIPNTVAKAVSALDGLAIDILTLHASGGAAMMRAANQAKIQASLPFQLVAVTVLTSLDEADLDSLGIQAPKASQQVIRLAGLADMAGIDHLVCSPQEVALLRQNFGDKFQLITPGVRPDGNDHSDQKRTMTPAEALQAGANWLVIGRPITQASDPATAYQAITASLADE